MTQYTTKKKGRRKNCKEELHISDFRTVLCLLLFVSRREIITCKDSNSSFTCCVFEPNFNYKIRKYKCKDKDIEIHFQCESICLSLETGPSLCTSVVQFSLCQIHKICQIISTQQKNSQSYTNFKLQATLEFISKSAPPTKLLQ